METEKQTIRALVIRLRLYIAQDVEYVRDTYQRYLFAVDVLNLSPGRGMTIMSNNKRIRQMSRRECEQELKRLSPKMYDVATMELREIERRRDCGR